MNRARHRRLLRRSAAAGVLLAAGMIAGCGKSSAPSTGAARPDPAIKIGFLVNSPDEPWFQLEWKFAEQAARDFGFTLQKIGVADGEKTLAAIDNLAAGGAQGFVICTPDTRLGPGIVAKARAANLKVLSVDDQFLGADGQPMASVPYVGISASRIGEAVGTTLAGEMTKRGWSATGTAVAVLTWDQLATAKERTDGAMAALRAAGFAGENLFKAPQRTGDIPGAFDAMNALLARQPGVERWLVCGNNDGAVLGAVRALEGRGFGPDTAIGVGINGTDCIAEFEKAEPTAFFGSMLLSARQHGYETAVMMYRWIKDGVAPPPDTRTTGVLMTRENFRAVLKEQGIRD